MDVDQMERLVSSFDVRLQRVFLQAVREMQAAPIVRLLEGGQVTSAVRYVEVAASNMGTEVGRAMQQAARAVAKDMTENIAVQVSFNHENFNSVRAIRSNSLRLIREVTDSQRRMFNSAILDGLRQGQNPRTFAREIKKNLGLTVKQEKAVGNYRRMLEGLGKEDGTTASDLFSRRLRDRRFDRTIARGQPLTPEQIETMTDRYRARMLKYRSEVIGRTEGLRSAHQGSEVMYQQAIENGTLQSDQIIRTWIASRDERVRSSHAALNGQQRPYGQPWGVLRYPGDPMAPGEETIQCRCVLTTRYR